jgi:gliding motility-associated-like protein
LKEIENIDELIKQGLSEFNPVAPPDAWDAIAQQLPSAPLAQPVGPQSPISSLMQTIKGLSIGVKLGVGLLLPVAVGVGFGFWPKGDVHNQMQQEETLVEKAPIAEPSLADVAVSEDSKIPLINEKEARPISRSVGKGKNAKLQNLEIRVSGEKKLALIPFNENNREEVYQAGEVAIGGVGEKPTEQIGVKDNLGKVDKLVTEHSNIEEEKVPVVEEKVGVISVPKMDPVYGNAFSPDGDGKNDVWEIRMDKPVFFLLRIMDRKGQLVFESDQPEKSWNGLNSRTGVECEVGTYSYILDYQFERSEKVKVKQGFINLLR